MPATAASAAPTTKVIEIVRSTLTPSSDAMRASCSQARWARPSAVRAINSVKAAIRITVVTMMMI